jgi:hypothetical protein
MTDSFFNSDIFIIATAVWVLPWKGWALWQAAKKKEKIWFIALLVVNTFAFLEIIYIFFGDQVNALLKKIGGLFSKDGAAGKHKA